MFGLEKGRPRGDLTALRSFPRRGGREGGAGLCTLGMDDRTQGNSTKLGLGRVRLGFGKNFFTTRVDEHWSGLPSKVRDAIRLSLFKSHLDALSEVL